MRGRGEVGKGLLGRAPVEGTHRETIVLSVPDSKLPLEILEGIKLVRSIEVFIIFPMTPLNFAVVPGGENPDSFVLDTKFPQRSLKVCWRRGV